MREKLSIQRQSNLSVIDDSIVMEIVNTPQSPAIRKKVNNIIYNILSFVRFEIVLLLVISYGPRRHLHTAATPSQCSTLALTRHII